MKSCHPNSPWNDEAKVEALKASWKDGAPASQIGDELGLSRSAILGKLHRLKLTGGRPTRQPTEESIKRRERAHRRNGTGFDGIARYARIKQRGIGTAPEKPIIEPDSSTRCQIEELTALTCRWPIGDPRERDGFSFCGAHAPDQPYCEFHHGRAYQGGSQ